MGHELILQDPMNGDAPSLLETILETSEGASGGGAMFAFASRLGISLLLEDAEFTRFTKRASFELVVGLDAVTNVASLELLKAIADRHPKLTVKAFLHSRKLTFHPKMCWFRSSTGGYAIVGSGNLTSAGLVNNWEAFSRVSLLRREASSIAAQWKSWIGLHQQNLKDVDDPAVLARASKNRMGLIREANASDDPFDAKMSVSTKGDVLVAEIPRGDDRWNQANFDIEHFRHYFHLEPGKTRRVLLQHFDAQGTAGPVEVRHGVSVKSKNYRIELAAAAKKPYPNNAPPIAVFLRTGIRAFRYRLLMPSDKDYSSIDKILAKGWQGSPNKMRRITLTSLDLKRGWPHPPL